MNTYQVTVTREDGLWVADIWNPDLGPAATDAARFTDLDTEVRDIIAGLTGSEPDEAILSWRFVIDEADVTQAVTRLLDAEAELRNATRVRTEARSQALRELADAGLSQSAIGDILGVTHQRVHQLLKAS
jgi:predicted XRE-type DNA-binding protein